MLRADAEASRQQAYPVYGRCMTRVDQIASDQQICHGQPTVRGTRHTVESLIELLASGMSNDEVLADYADLTNDDILAALEFVALSAAGGRVIARTSA